MSLCTETCSFLNVTENNLNEMFKYNDINSTCSTDSYSNKSHAGNYINYPIISNRTHLNQNNEVYTHTEITDIINNYSGTSGIDYTPRIISVDITKEMRIAMNACMKIKDVEIVVPNKVVRVTFDDNTAEKSVCHDDDTFSLEMAITICMTKHLLGSSGKFNNILAKGVKIVEDKVKAAEEAEKEKARIEAKRLKNHNKRVERRKKKEADARKARIQETAEAIVLANELMKTEAKNKEDK